MSDEERPRGRRRTRRAHSGPQAPSRVGRGGHGATGSRGESSSGMTRRPSSSPTLAPTRVTSTPAPARSRKASAHTHTPLAPPRRSSHAERRDPRELWAERFAKRLPEVTQRAAGPVARSLIETLAKRKEERADDALLEELDERLDALLAARADLRRIRETLRQAAGLGQLRNTMIEVLREISPPGRFRADRRALRRNLDAEAIEDRLLRREHAALQPVSILCVVLSGAPRLDADRGRATRIRRRLVRVAEDRSWPWTLREAALRAIGTCASGADDARNTVRAVRALAEDPTQDPWVQATALGTWLQLRAASTDAFGVLEQALDPTSASERHPDHAFFRARAVGLAARRQAWAEIRVAARRGDPSEHVRMATLRALAGSPSGHDLAVVVDAIRGAEPSPRVRAAAALAAVDVGERRVGIRVVREALGADVETVRIVLSGLHYRQRPEALTDELARERLAAWGPSIQRWRDDETVHQDVRVDAAAVLLALEVASEPELASIWRAIDTWAVEASAGDTSSLSTPMRDSEKLLDVLALVAQHTQDLGAKPTAEGWKLFHGPQVRPTLWRLVHEVFHPRPDKRQAISHVVDHIPRGRLVAPSGCMAEVTRTAVPGRPVASPSERWWGPDFPLPSWTIAAAQRGSLDLRALPDVRMTLSARPLGRAVAPAAYVRLAELRESSRDAPAGEGIARFDRALSRVGIDVKRHGFGVFAAGSLPVLDQVVGELVPTARQLLSLDGNSLPQLAVFSVLVGAGWATTAAVRQQRARAARSRVPLVIGGWGSRGKSGVERLKAAIFHELGYPVVSKTTGNEAMFVVGFPGREPVEVFLYRPYDRASIVEQREVLHLADRLGVQVLLWECMALNPRYVDILQQDWMRDDLTTITNTYPDHEDIQGPSGLDVAKAIATVLPREARALTAEQSMTPVLAEEARRRGTQLDALSPEAWELLPEDVLARFPYEEHPRNIALVVALGRSLGIRSDVALRAMADRVVPDLGVLKAYGPAQVQGREVSFIVGNSANERAGFLSNWQRMDFDACPDDAGLLDVTALVVNNRRDRLARQAVFARVAALDAPADRLVVIGTNVRPFVRAFESALKNELRPGWLERLSRPQELAKRMAERLRRPLLDVDAATRVLSRAQADRPLAEVEKQVEAAFGDAVAAVPPAPLALRTPDDAGEQWLSEVAWLAAVSAHDAELPETILEGALALVRARTLALNDPELSGEAITDAVVQTVPRGCALRMLGAANIKGTGLDLVYRWVQVDRVRGLLHEVLTGAPSRAASALRTLTSLELGPIERTEIRARLEPGLTSLQDTEVRVLAEELLRQVEAAGEAGAVQRTGSVIGRTLRRGVANVDVDSVVRRRAADRLYRDLAEGRVGLERAAKIAKELVSRQKVD